MKRFRGEFSASFEGRLSRVFVDRHELLPVQLYLKQIDPDKDFTTSSSCFLFRFKRVNFKRIFTSINAS